MNEYDSNRIYGYQKNLTTLKPTMLKTDCYVLNTCHGRKSNRKSLPRHRRVKKNLEIKPIVIVTGCVAQAEGSITEKEKYIDAVIGPQSYHLLEKIIKILKKN